VHGNRVVHVPTPATTCGVANQFATLPRSNSCDAWGWCAVRGPNYALALALAEAKWTNSETARRINHRAQQQGHSGVAVDKSRVGRWIRHGERPRPPVPQLLAELLTEELSRLHTPESLGIAPSRRVLVLLNEQEHQALAADAAAANMPLEVYATALVRSALPARSPVPTHGASSERLRTDYP